MVPLAGSPSQWLSTYPESEQAMPYCFVQRGLRNILPEQIEGALGYFSMDLTAPIVAQSIRPSWFHLHV